MYKLWIATYKEFLLLKRDVGGLIILFLMPLVLVITVTLIQNSSFVKDDNVKVPILLIDHDKDELSESIIENLVQANTFDIFTDLNGEPINEDQANDLVLRGKYKMALIIPKGLTTNLNKKVAQNVNKILNEMGVEDEKDLDHEIIETQEIKLCFDPAAHLSFKNEVKNTIDKLASKIESEAIYKNFQKELDNDDLIPFPENYILIELSFISAPPLLEERIFQLVTKGYTPILAHPERYLYWSENYSYYERLI